MQLIFLALALLLALAGSAHAQGGPYVRADCTTLTSPATGTVCWETSTLKWRYYSGSAWTDSTPAGPSPSTWTAAGIGSISVQEQ